MDYTDQLVLTGEINDVGNPVMTNVKDSYRAGIELIAGYRFTDWLQWGGNVTFSRNKIRNMTAHIDNWDYWNNPDENPLQYEEEFNITDISFSPGIIAGSRLEISPFQNFDIEFLSKYVGKQYIDNTSSEARKLDPWFVNDLRLNYSFNTKWSKDLSLNVLIANIFNHKYESNAWTYRYFYEGEKSYMTAFYPQAGIHFMAGLRLSF